MVYPGMVYISHPTEYGTLYTKEELQSLSRVCRRHQIPLFMDGARLGYGLMSNQTNVTIEDVAKYCDVFYIGGTKIEHFVVKQSSSLNKMNLKLHYNYKTSWCFISKRPSNWCSILELFTDDLYFDISRHAIKMAEKVKRIYR